MKKDKIYSGGEMVGQFRNGGKNKYLPMWSKKRAVTKSQPTTAVTKSQPTTAVIKRNHTIEFDLWNLFKWAMITMIMYLIWTNTDITFTFNW